MAGDDTNDDPGTFWTADVEEAAARARRGPRARGRRGRDDLRRPRRLPPSGPHPGSPRRVPATELAGTPRVYEATADADHFAEQIRAIRDAIPPEIADEMPTPEEFENNFTPAALITTRVDVRGLPRHEASRARVALESGRRELVLPPDARGGLRRRVRHRVVHPPGRTRRHPGDLAVPVSASAVELGAVRRRAGDARPRHQRAPTVSVVLRDGDQLLRRMARVRAGALDDPRPRRHRRAARLLRRPRPHDRVDRTRRRRAWASSCSPSSCGSHGAAVRP